MTGAATAVIFDRVLEMRGQYGQTWWYRGALLAAHCFSPSESNNIKTSSSLTRQYKIQVHILDTPHHHILFSFPSFSPHLLFCPFAHSSYFQVHDAEPEQLLESPSLSLSLIYAHTNIRSLCASLSLSLSLSSSSLLPPSQILHFSSQPSYSKHMISASFGLLL